MKKIFTLAAAILASFSLAWGTATNYHDFVAGGDTIISIETTGSSTGLSNLIAAVNNTDWAAISTSSKNATVKRIDPATDEVASSTSNVYGTKLSSSQKSIFKVTGVEKVSFYIGGGSSRIGYLDVEPEGGAKIEKAAQTKALSNEVDVISYELDESKSYTLTAYGNNDIFCYAVKFTVASKCAAGKPGDISKGALTAGSLTLNAAGAAAAGDTWYWQTTADGTDKANSGSSFVVTTAGTYYIRSYNATAECWSAAKSFEVKAIDLTENFTVKYLDGTEVLGQEPVAVGSKPVGIEEPKKECYTFAGWQKAGVDVALSDITGAANEVIELTAKWTPIYAVSFNFGDSTSLTKDNINATLKAAGYACKVGTSGSYDNGGTTGYLGYKFKNKGDYVAFLIAAGHEAVVTYGYTESGWQVNGADAGVAVKTQAYVDKKYKAVGSDLLIKIVNQSADSKTSALTKIIISKSAATSPSDATLSELSVEGYALTPAFAPATLEYNITKAYGADSPAKSKITAVPNSEVHSLTIDSLAGKYTITVVSQDESDTKVYTINVLTADAPKNLSRVLFSNGFDAFIDNTNLTVKAFYLAGQEAPTANTITAGAGTPGEYKDGKIIVTGADSKTAEYIVTLEAVTPNTAAVASTDAAGVFDGTEAWVKNGLLISGNSAGFNGGNYVLRRQIKSSDPATDQRVIAGLVRTYFFVGNASKLELTVGGNNKVKYAVDGGEYTTSEANTLAISLTEGNHMIEVVTNQQSGDCNLSAPKLIEATATALDNTDAAVKAVKAIENGQLVVIKNGVKYNVLGNVIR